MHPALSSITTFKVVLSWGTELLASAILRFSETPARVQTRTFLDTHETKINKRQVLCKCTSGVTMIRCVPGEKSWLPIDKCAGGELPGDPIVSRRSTCDRRIWTKPLARRTRWSYWVLHARFALCSSGARLGELVKDLGESVSESEHAFR